MYADRTEASDWEKFHLDGMSESDHEKVSIRTAHNYYLCANQHRLESRGEAGEWETFTLLPLNIQQEDQPVSSEGGDL